MWPRAYIRWSEVGSGWKRGGLFINVLTCVCVCVLAIYTCTCMCGENETIKPFHSCPLETSTRQASSLYHPGSMEHMFTFLNDR